MTQAEKITETDYKRESEKLQVVRASLRKNTQKLCAVILASVEAKIDKALSEDSNDPI